MGVDQYRLGTRGYGTHHAVLDLIESGSRVLDVGAASGYLAHLAQIERHATVIAVESDPAGCEACRRRGVTVIQGDISSLLASGTIAEQGPFSQIVLADVLEHIVDPSPVLARLAEVLAPDGTAIISVPNIAYARSRARLLIGRWRYEDTGIFDRTHVRFFDRRGIAELIRSAGLEVIREVPIGPAGYAFGRRGLAVTALRPSLLASQFVLLAGHPTR